MNPDVDQKQQPAQPTNPPPQPAATTSAKKPLALGDMVLQAAIGAGGFFAVMYAVSGVDGRGDQSGILSFAGFLAALFFTPFVFLAGTIMSLLLLHVCRHIKITADMEYVLIYLPAVISAVYLIYAWMR